MAISGLQCERFGIAVRQRALALDTGTKGFLGFGYNLHYSWRLTPLYFFTLNVVLLEPPWGFRYNSEGNRSIRYRSFAHPLAMLPEPLKGF